MFLIYYYIIHGYNYPYYAVVLNIKHIFISIGFLEMNSLLPVAKAMDF